MKDKRIQKYHLAMLWLGLIGVGMLGMGIFLCIRSAPKQVLNGWIKESIDTLPMYKRVSVGLGMPYIFWYVNTYLDSFLKGILYFADFTFRMLLTLSLRGYDFLFLRGFLLLRTALKQAITTTLNINSALRHPVLQKSIILLIFFSILFR